MSLEKIVKKIGDDAQAEEARITLESQKKAEEIKEAAKKEASELAQVLVREVERQANLEASRIITQARLEKRIKVLSCKKELINEVLERAFQKEGVDKKELRRKIILKDGEKEESFDEEKLKAELYPKLENYIAQLLKI